MIKKKLRSALFLKTEAGLSLGKIFLSEILPKKLCKNYRAARCFSFCAFCLKAAEGIGASQNIFVHSAFLAYVFL